MEKTKIIGQIADKPISGITLVATSLFGGVSLYALTVTGMIVVDIWRNLF